MHHVVRCDVLRWARFTPRHVRVLRQVGFTPHEAQACETDSAELRPVGTQKITRFLLMDNSASGIGSHTVSEV